MGWFTNIVEKLNPAQPQIVMDQGTDHSTTINRVRASDAYYSIEVVQRGTNLLVDSASPITFDIKEKNTRNKPPVTKPDQRFTKHRLNEIINIKPNPYQDINHFKRLLYTDLILEGNAFIYFDGYNLFILPATNVNVEADKQTFVKHYEYGEKKFYPNEIIHIRDNSAKSIYRGDSRLLACSDSITLLKSMMDYQTNFFNNNAIPGLVLKTPNTLSQKVKDRIKASWKKEYNPRTGGKSPAILDGDFSIENLGHTDNRELDFNNSFSLHEGKILKALGVPPILLDSGNNANISPNLRMFYLNTILPMVDKVASAFEFFFGYDLKPVHAEILALRPELKEESQYLTSLTNAGIMSVNEAREKIRLEKSTEAHADRLIIPANIAGSAVDPSQGGRPEEESEED